MKQKRMRLSSYDVMDALKDDPKALQAYREYLDQYHIEMSRHRADNFAAQFDRQSGDVDNQYSNGLEDRYDEESFA